LKYLLFTAPRTQKGAISHRTNQTQLWSDFLYMAPPFIAYYGALQSEPEGDSLLWMAYEQVKLYREELFDKKVGLWRHTALGNRTDDKHWATGNAWAAAGALRVLATIQHSRTSKSESMRSHQKDLTKWVGETLDGVWKFQVGVHPFLPSYFVRSDAYLCLFKISTSPLEKERHTPKLHRPSKLVP
jgi:rhamnogalacturonyl hydrolase YesR